MTADLHKNGVYLVLVCKKKINKIFLKARINEVKVGLTQSKEAAF